jgi:hypothetical protein
MTMNAQIKRPLPARAGATKASRGPTPPTRAVSRSRDLAGGHRLAELLEQLRQQLVP